MLNNLQNQIKQNQIMMLILAQIVIFALAAVISYFTGFAYSMVLAVAGVGIMLLMLPFNMELQSYRDSAHIMMHHAHHQALEQMSNEQARWHDNIINTLYGLIPFFAGIIIAFL